MPIIYLTLGTSWTVPADWSNGNNSIECIGGGGAGGGGWYDGKGNGNQSDWAGGGGGGGAYSAIFSFGTTPGNIITYHVGGGGNGPTPYNTNGNIGGDTWFNGANLAASSVGAKGALGGYKGQSSGGGGAGGLASGGVGTVKYSGGTGANGGQYPIGGGGGGAAGPNGNGTDGGVGFYAQAQGGPADNNTVAGAPPGNYGNTGAEWPAVGCGSGGGGSNYTDAGGGGYYGGGGGGWGYGYGGANNNYGAPGIIIIKYYIAHPQVSTLIGM